MIYQISTDTIETALKMVNTARLENKDRWLFATITLPYDHTVELKSFNTSIQILRKDGIRFPSTFNASVKDWKKAIERALRYVQPLDQKDILVSPEIMNSI